VAVVRRTGQTQIPSAEQNWLDRVSNPDTNEF
jgi:hypothetical protein